MDVLATNIRDIMAAGAIPLYEGVAGATPHMPLELYKVMVPSRTPAARIGLVELKTSIPNPRACVTSRSLLDTWLYNYVQ